MKEAREKQIESMVKYKSLNKALRVLECFTIENPELGISDISKKLGLNKSNVFDILATFEAREYVHKDPLTNKYSLYNASLRLAGVINRTRLAKDEVSIMVRDLARETNETVYYGILYDNHVMYLDYMSAATGIVPMQFIGAPAPLHCTATGKAILSAMREEEVGDVISLGLTRFTENTLADPDKLLEDLKVTRQRGYSIDNMEHEYGIKGVGLVVEDTTGHPYAAVSVSGPSLRFNEKSIPEIVQLIKRHSRKLSTAILNEQGGIV
jgi:DNA-binding IclR family transcriptional regulator